MVVLLIHDAADHEEEQGIAGTKEVELQRGYRTVDDNCTEVLDDAVDRVQQEPSLNFRRITVQGIEDNGQVVQQSQEDAVEILGVPEENIPGGQDHADPDIEYSQTDDREDQGKHMRTEGDPVEDTEDEVDSQGQQEVDEGRDVAGEQEKVLRDIDLLDDPGVVHQAGHTVIGRFPEEGHDDIA